MSARKKKQSSSPYPTQPPLSRDSKSSKIHPEDIEQELGEAIAADDNPRILELIDAAPRWMKRQPDFMLLRATALIALGENHEALRLLQEITQKNPRFSAVHLPLAILYYDQDWLAHALQSARRALSIRDLTEDGRQSIEEIIQESTDLIRSISEELDLPTETMQRAMTFYEKAEMAMDENRFPEADRLLKEAIKLAPRWTPPYNSRARALYMSGNTAEGISISEAVLAMDPENSFALSNLVGYHLGLNQVEQALEYANRLVVLSDQYPDESIDMDLVINALAYIEDTSNLWKIARRYLKKQPDDLYSHSWYILAVAAIRSGKWKDALRLVENANEQEPNPAGEELIEELRSVVFRRQPALDWMPPAYPTAHFYLHPKIVDELTSLFKGIDGQPTPTQKRRIDSFFQKYPFVLYALKRMLWDQKSNSMALELLLSVDLPEADEEILRFALSQTGSQTARLAALTLLNRLGRYKGPERIKFWIEEQNEWHDVLLNVQKIGPIEPNARPETMAVIEQANRAANQQDAIQLLRRAVEMEPDSPIALFNLGVILIQSGETEEGEALVWRSVEVDPEYHFGHASIALFEVNRGNVKEAMDHLEIVSQAETIAPETAVLANLAWASIAIKKHDFDSARRHLDLARRFNPEHPMLESIQKTLEEAEAFHKSFGFLFEFQRESILRTHKKLLKKPLSSELNLYLCLEMNTKEMLVATAHYWGISSSGKKAELVSRLAEEILDPDSLQRILVTGLERKERSALQWVVEAGGVRPWKEFVQKYGDDSEESVVWDYHEPESIPGRLRRSGLLFTGLYEGREVVFIPADLCRLMAKLLP